MTAILPDVITVRIKDACRITGIGRSKIYELIAASEIETVKVGCITLIPIEGLRSLIDRHKKPQVMPNLAAWVIDAEC